MFHMTACIQRKRDGKALPNQEIEEMIRAYVAKEIPDYQMAAFLMAVYFQGMTLEETRALTRAIATSGEQIDLHSLGSYVVDKHSTGGVGDKTTLIVAPLVAACGLRVAKMSGRGLGHTGGTIDKLESIPGFQTTLDRRTFFRQVERIGLAVMGQSGNLTPADKLLYALRDVTATVDSLPLIASSIMGKKLAAGSPSIVLDVKQGHGAFMKKKEEAEALAHLMVQLGTEEGRQTRALVTAMDQPLGHAIGNALEVKEALLCLQGGGPEDLRELCLALAGEMLQIGRKLTEKEAREKVEMALDSGAALERFGQMVEAQGGDPSVIENLHQLPQARYRKTLLSEEEGYLEELDALACGRSSALLGAGRETKSSTIDLAAGIELQVKQGDQVAKGAPLAILFSSKPDFGEAEKTLRAGMKFSQEAPLVQPLIQARIDSPCS